MNRPSNVDSQEISKFDRVAQLWWDPNGKMGMLHVINPLRSQFTFEHTDVRGKRVVDVGCGGGILTETLAKAGASGRRHRPVRAHARSRTPARRARRPCHRLPHPDGGRARGAGSGQLRCCHLPGDA